MRSLNYHPMPPHLEHDCTRVCVGIWWNNCCSGVVKSCILHVERVRRCWTRGIARGHFRCPFSYYSLHYTRPRTTTFYFYHVKLVIIWMAEQVDAGRLWGIVFLHIFCSTKHAMLGPFYTWYSTPLKFLIHRQKKITMENLPRPKPPLASSFQHIFLPRLMTYLLPTYFD